MISVFRMTYLLSNIAHFWFKVKSETDFWRKKNAGLYGPAGKKETKL